MKFSKEKAFLTVFLVWCAAILLPAWTIGETVNIQTLDGYFFPNAELMSVDAGGITICCTNQQNEPVLRGITFDRLPMEIRLRYGYDPEKFAAYQKKVGTYRPPAEPAQSRTQQTAPAKPQDYNNDDVEDANLSLTIAPIDWYYHRTKYYVPRYPARPPHKPGPHKPGPHKPGPIKPGPVKPGYHPAPRPGQSIPAKPGFRPGR